MVGLYDGSEGEFQFLFTSRDTGFGGRVWPSAILAVAFPLRVFFVACFWFGCLGSE